MYKKTGNMPDGLRHRPIISTWLQPYLVAYHRLDRRRQMGYSSPQPLAASDILSFGNNLGFSSDLQFFFKVMESLDEVYMEEVAKKQKAELAKSKNNNRKGGKRK